MNTVLVRTGKPYKVKIGAGLLGELGQEMHKLFDPCTAAVITDSNVAPLYGEIAKISLENAGFRVVFYTVPAGEASKSGGMFLQLLSFLAENRVTRSDFIVALGGGVVGDLAGFAAACYLRGIPYVQVPTTLLAAVDSSVGGKTAIDLPQGKNLAGAFYQPKLVLCDPDTLSTLPGDIFLDGCAEVLKYGVLFDRELFFRLRETGPAFDREAVITRCVELKQDVVHRDEYDTGLRQLLNLGHTLGHGVEAFSAFTVSHGKAVAIGMAIAARAAAKMGTFPEEEARCLVETLEAFGLPTRTDAPPAALYAAALSDKKRQGGTVTLVLPDKIGQCSLCPTPVEQLQTFIEAGY